MQAKRNRGCLKLRRADDFKINIVVLEWARAAKSRQIWKKTEGGLSKPGRRKDHEEGED